MGKRTRLVGGGTVFLLLLYLALFPRPLGRELVVRVDGATALENSETLAQPESPLYPFQLQSWFGYLDADGALSYLDTTQGGLALAPEGFINYSTVSETHVFQDPSGRIERVIQASGYPIVRAGRVFVIGPGGASLSEWDSAGARLWQRDFPSLITAFDAGRDTAVLGLLSGELIFLDSGGQAVQSYRSRRSRIPVVYGLSLVEPAGRVALVSGIDPQILTVLEYDGDQYAPRFERDLRSSFREPVPVYQLESAGRVVLEYQNQDWTTALLSIRNDGRDASVLVPAGRLHSLLEQAGPGLHAALSERSGEGEVFELLLWSNGDREFGRVLFRAEAAYLGPGPAGSILLGIDSRVLQLRLEEA